MRTKRILVSLLIAGSLVLNIGLAFSPTVSAAATAENCSQSGAGFLQFPTWYKYLDPKFEDGECKFKFIESKKNGLINAVPRVLLASFDIILRIAGIAALGFIIYGGIRYILSQGEPDQTKASKNTIINALVGLAITIFATAIVNLIGNNLS